MPPDHRSCPVCGQHHAQVLFRPRESPGPVSKCLHCGMVYITTIEDSHALIFDGPVIHGNTSPQILMSSNVDDVKDLWEFTCLPDKEAEWRTIQRNSIDALQRLEPYINKYTERRILDFGSGWGFFLAVARERGWNTYGLEPLLACAVYARAKFNLNITIDTLRENTFPQEVFDVITSFQVFEHLPHPKKDIEHLHKMLRKDGIILIEAPNFDTWTMRIVGSRHRHFVQDHLNFFSITTLCKLLTDSGYEVLDHYYPTRRMSVRHLTNNWFSRYLPAPLASVLQNSLQRTAMWEQTIGLNIGDVIAVIARKV